MASQGFPQINAPLVDTRTGQITPSWQRLLVSLWERTGAATGINTPYDPSNVQITGGTIDGTEIGDGSPAPGTFTVLRSTINFQAANFSGSSSGVNTGNVTLAGENYLSIANQVITANPVNVSGSNATGTLAAGRFPALTGDVTTSAGSLTTTLATVNASPGTYQNATVTVNGKGLATLVVAGATPVADGTYTVGARLTGGGTDGEITVVGGIITAITEAT